MDDLEFAIRPGRLGDRGRRGRSFVGEALRAAARAGGRIPPGPARRACRGRGAGLEAALRASGRRVVVKARVVRHRGARFRAAPLAVHIGYLKRDGVERAGAPGRLFDAGGDADGRAFAARCAEDRHHFRVIVSPEDAGELVDLEGFTRGLMAGAEADLGTRLDWIAAAHWNTAHPHVHVLVRGVAEDGRDLVIAREYIARGLRARAERLVTLELGPRTGREIAAALQRQVEAERWTELDAVLAGRAGDGVVDLRRGGPGRDLRPALVGRAETLARLGLAVAVGPGRWRLSPDHWPALEALARRAEVLARLDRAGGAGRPRAELVPEGERLDGALLGRLAARGLNDPLTGEAYVILDGLDGRLRHVRLPSLAAAGDTPPGGLVELQPSASGLRLVHRSDLALEAQVSAAGATWLDRRLVAAAPAPLAAHGFAAEARAALRARAEVLRDRGLAVATAGGLRFADDLVGRLRRTELAAAGRRLAAETGLVFHEGGPEVRGRYLRRVDLASGRFALVAEGGGFRLAPWAAALDRRLGREVRGRWETGRMVWDLGRDLSR